jgi:hypothetical protein
MDAPAPEIPVGTEEGMRGTSENTKGKLGKAVRAGAAYGVLAAGAYGCHSASTPPEADKPQKQTVVQEDDRLYTWEWSQSKEFQAQTKFLQLVYAAFDSRNASEKQIRKAVDESYAKAKGDLGAMFKGNMTDKVTSVDFTKTGGFDVTLSYSGTGEVVGRAFKVRYHIDRMLIEEAALLPRVEKIVRIVTWTFSDDGGKLWTEKAIPEAMLPTTKVKYQGDPGCSYPKWNPQGVRYGFVGRRKIGM